MFFMVPWVGLQCVIVVFSDHNHLLFDLRRKCNIFLEIITCDPSVYTMDHPGFIISNFMENSIGLKKVKVKNISS